MKKKKAKKPYEWNNETKIVSVSLFPGGFTVEVALSKKDFDTMKKINKEQNTPWWKNYILLNPAEGK